MKLAQARLARQSQSNDRSQASPFDSMLDDHAATASDRARAPAPKSEAQANTAPRRDDAASASKPSDTTRASADNDKAPKGKSTGGDTPDHAKSAGDTGKDGATGKTDKTGEADKAGKTDKAGASADDKSAAVKTDAADTLAAASSATLTDATAAAKLAQAAPAAAAVTVAVAAGTGEVTAAASAVPTTAAGLAQVAAAAEQAASLTGISVAKTATTDSAGKPDFQTSAQTAAQATSAPSKTDSKADSKASPKTDPATKPGEARAGIQAADADGAPPAGNNDGTAQAAPGSTDKPQTSHPHNEAPATGHTSASPDAAALRADPAAPTASTAATDAAAQQAASARVTGASPAAGVTTAASAAAPAAGLQSGAVPLAGVAVEIAGKALAGKNHFEIRLDPPELGRIEVHLDVDRDGQVTSRLIAERSDTLDLLRRDSTGLERALQDAGLKTSNNGLQFSLRDGSTGQERQQSNSNTAQLVVNETGSADAVPQSYSRFAGRAGGLDISV